MARYSVEKDGEWNIFSTVVDDFLFDEFVCLDTLKARLLYERFKELTKDMDSLLTDNPRVNVMAYSEAIEQKIADTPQTDLVKDSDDLVKDLVKDAPQTEQTEPKQGTDCTEVEPTTEDCSMFAVVKPYTPTNREILDALEKSDCPWR